MLWRIPWKNLMRRVFFAFMALLCTRPVLAQPAPESPPPSIRSNVVPPRLVHFEPASYPAIAKEQGLDGTVGLLITIDKEGNVKNVVVKEPAGHGFDEAATEAATHFVFEPAKRAEVPVPAKILYRYQFKLETKVSTVENTSPAAIPQVGELRGRIVAGTPPSPLVGIKVRILARDRTTLVVETATDGTFSVPNLIKGQYVLEIEGTGYRRVSHPEQIEEGKVTAVTYHLEPSSDLPLEVTVRGPAFEREVTHYEIPRTELLRVPGTMGDAIHAVEAMPSVARPRGLSGDLVIRGSAAEDSQVYVEGTPIPQVFHFGDLSSVVPGEMIERLEFYPSNFSVRYGRVMGGVVEAKLRQTNPDNKYHGTAQIDLINARVNVEGPVPKMRNYSFMGGARTSYFDRWLSPIMRDGASSEDGLPRYYDYQFYLERRLPKNGVYRMGFIGARDTFVPILKNSKEWYVPRQSSFIHFQSQLRMPLSSKSDIKASWSIGKNQNALADEDRSTDATYILGTLRSEISYKTGSVGIIRFGADVLYAPFRVKAHTDRKNVSGTLASNSSIAKDLIDYDIRGVYLRPAFFAEYEFSPNRRVNLTVGTRGDYAKDTHDIDIAPRAIARYLLVDGPLSTRLKSGVGLFYQPPSPIQTLPELGTKGLTSSRAVHSMVGVEQTLSKNVALSVEGFEKELRKLLSTREDGAGNEIIDNRGRGRVYGVDFLLRYNKDDRFFGWVAYTLSRSTRKPNANEPEELYRYDQTHIINLLGSYRIGRGWEIGARFRYATGLPYKTCSGSLFNNATGAYRCYGVQQQQRLDAFHQLDLRLEKVFQTKTYRLSAYLDVLNAYGHYSPDKAVENYDYSGVKPLSRSLPLLPSIGVRGEI
jgi:TonB family protein